MKHAMPLPTPAGIISRQFHAFAKQKFAGASLLLVATVLALLWANSAYADSYRDILRLRIVVGFGDTLRVDKSVLHWVNDGVMGVFFFSVGLEIKRELIAGELSTLRKAVLPAASALGGMVVPAVIFVAFTANTEAVHGWGIPMATDIAFALGVLGLLGSRVPAGLKVFLTGVAIADDIGAILVIAAFYSGGIAWGSLAAAGVLYALAVAGNRLGVRNSLFYLLLGTCVWVAFSKSGVHATLAAVLMAFAIPARTRIDGAQVIGRLEQLVVKGREREPRSGKRLPTAAEQELYSEMTHVLSDAASPLVQLENALVPLITFVVLPVFALANAGVDLSANTRDIFDPVALGIIAGLVAGKPVGITAAAWLAVRVGVADLPTGVRWKQIIGVGMIAGIGFTMSLFISSLAFKGERAELAKIGIMTASSLAAVAGLLLLWRVAGSSRQPARREPDPAS